MGLGNIRKTNALSKREFIYDWSVYGVLARGTMMILYTLLSTKRKEQIRKVLMEQ